MKRILLAFALIFALCFSSDARMGAVVCGGGSAAGGGTSCSTATDYVGSKTEQGSTSTIASGQMACWKYTATCSGTVNCTLNTAHIYAVYADCNARAALYSAGNTSTPYDASNELLDYSGDIAAAGVGLDSTAAMTNHASVTNGTTYWVCVAASSTAWGVYVGSTGASRWVGTCSGCYTTPPANLGSFNPTETANRELTGWITVGP